MELWDAIKLLRRIFFIYTWTELFKVFYETTKIYNKPLIVSAPALLFIVLEGGIN